MADYGTIPTHVSEAVAAEPISESFVRATFGGGLDRFQPLGPDDFVYVLVPTTGRRDLPVDTSFRWTDFHAMPEAVRPVDAHYTVRRFRPDVAEVTAVSCYLRREVGLSREQVSMTPYWRHAARAEDPADADD